MGRLASALLSLVAAAGCFPSVDYGDTEYMCLDGESCPDGFLCIDQRCVVEPPSAPVRVSIPESTFLMGCDWAAPGCEEDSAPAHLVTVSAFAIDRTEVTRLAYGLCAEADECDQPGDLGLADDPGAPVAGVSWEDAATYCAFAGGRLPTEAEWELAARGQTGASYPWGEAFPDCELAHHDACGEDGPISAGSPPGDESPLGVHGLAGNVAEWVADWYEWDYYLYSPGRDPTGPRDGYERVVRGGSFDDGPSELRVWLRSSEDPFERDHDTGFRCAY